MRLPGFVLAAFLAVPAQAALIVTDHRNAWLGSLPGIVALSIDEGLGDEPVAGGTTQSLTLNGSGIVVSVTEGMSSASADLSTKPNSLTKKLSVYPFPTRFILSYPRMRYM